MNQMECCVNKRKDGPMLVRPHDKAFELNDHLISRSDIEGWLRRGRVASRSKCNPQGNGEQEAEEQV
jgi:hypothetical protein